MEVQERPQQPHLIPSPKLIVDRLVARPTDVHVQDMEISHPQFSFSRTPTTPIPRSGWLPDVARVQ